MPIGLIQLAAREIAPRLAGRACGPAGHTALGGLSFAALRKLLFLLLFAATHSVLARRSTSNFGEHPSHTDDLHFTVTVFSTAGSGDITAQTQTARLVLAGQMTTDLIIPRPGDQDRRRRGQEQPTDKTR